jgi:hypothetical protein
MRRILFSSFLILLTTPALIFAQRDSLRSVFLNAESWFLFEEYAEALTLYESLYKSDPGNDNLNYKIGICLLNDPYQKDKAIQYLLDASKNINPSYKEGSFKERAAPPDALYYLGDAYLVNELLNHAIESYEEFLTVMDREVYDEELVNAQIRSCKNAQRLKTMPVDIDLTLIDPIINTRYSDINPVVSGDGTKLAFVSELPFYDGAFYTEKQEDGWSYPQIITQMLGFDEDVYPVALSHDGTEMILYYDDDYIGNLYYSKMENGMWSPAIKMGPNISTKYWESHASFSKDGKSLYFTSNRKGTQGGLDIYLSERQYNGTWGIPVNLGSTVNTRYNEDCPVISEDGQTLYFSSYGHFNMGGYDIFYSKKGEDGSWGEPVNIGYPINTTDDDLFFQPINDGNGAYYSLYSPSGIGLHDIYYLNIYSVNNPRLYSIAGNLRTEDGRVDSTEMAIYVIDADTGDTLVFTSPTKEGSFAFELKKGIYELHFKGEGYEDMISPLQITDASNKGGVIFQDAIELALIQIDPLLFEGEESDIKLEESQYVGVAGVPIAVPLKAPKGSTVLVRTYQDSVWVSTDTLLIGKRRTDLETIPLPGKSIVELEMTDEDGNIHRNRIAMTGTKLVVKEPAKALDEEPFIEPEQPNHVDPLGIMLLQEKLIAHSDGPLKEYLKQVDLEKEGITSSEELMDHLQDMAGEQGYEMNEVRKALLEDLDQSKEFQLTSSKLLQNSDGLLLATLVALIPAAEGIESEKDLYHYLYDQADQQGYSIEEIDALLASEIGKNDVELLQQKMLEHADGALMEYLEQLDLETQGIHTSEELLNHLEEAAVTEGFRMEEVRKAMLESLGDSLKLERIYEELLLSTDGEVKEILESMDLRGDGIYSIAELIDSLSRKLGERGYSKKEIEETLAQLFGDKYDRKATRTERKGMPLVVFIGAAVIIAGIIWFIIAWLKRRENGEKQGN